MKYTKEERNEYQKKYRLDRKKYWMSLLCNKCSNCGSVDNLEFDHIDRKTKKFPISMMYDKKEKEVIEELKKCQLLCDVCHKEKTKKEWDNGTIKPWRKLPDHSMYGYSKGCRCDVCKEAKRKTR
jgi:5-methylcytosine-specific restriction endonuclease McrA